MNQLPKKFIDGAIGSYGKYIFSFALTSGDELNSFTTTPQIMKSIASWMNERIESYEKDFGKIDMTPPKITSPIQKSDLQKPKNGK